MVRCRQWPAGLGCAKAVLAERCASGKVCEWEGRLERPFTYSLCPPCMHAGGTDPDQKLIDVRMNAIKRRIIVLSGKGGRMALGSGYPMLCGVGHQCVYS